MAFSLDRYKELTQITTYQDVALGIMRWGTDNSFPQTLKNIVEQSPTAKPAVERTARFYKGGEFEGEDTVVNSMGLTLRDIVDFASQEHSFFNGFAIHTDWNLNGEIVSMTPISLTDLRLAELDELNYAVKIGYHYNFGLNDPIRKTVQQTPTKDKIKWFDRFNPEAVLPQIERAEGVSNYNGQLMFVSNAGHSSYPIPPLQSSINYVLSDVENSVLVRKETSTGFINSYILKSTLNPEDPNLIALEEAIKQTQGARGSGKVITMAGLSEAELSNTVLEEIGGGAGTAGAIIDAADNAYRLAREVILGTYLIPPILGGADQKTGFTSSELEDAYYVFNANTKPGRDTIEANINRLLKNSIFDVKEIKLNKLKLDVDEEEELKEGEQPKQEGEQNV